MKQETFDKANDLLWVAKTSDERARGCREVAERLEKHSVGRMCVGEAVWISINCIDHGTKVAHEALIEFLRSEADRAEALAKRSLKEFDKL